MRRPEIRALAFDLGGVVLKSHYEGAFLRNASKKLGTSPSQLRPVIRREVGLLERGEQGTTKFWRTVCERLEITAPSPGALKSLWLYQYRQNTKIDPAMRRLIVSLRERYPVIAISNTITDHITVNRRRGLFDLFDCVLLSAEVGLRKPQKGIFRLASRRLRTPPESIVFIDDDARWVRAARASGLRAVRFTSASDLRRQLRRYRILT